MHTVLASRGGGHLVQPFILPHRQFDGAQVDSVDSPLRTLTAHNGGDNALVEPMLVSYYGNGGATRVSDPVPTVTTKDRFGLVEPGARLDIRFRMLQPHELAAAMGFPSGYPFKGNRGDVIRQIGNAVAVNVATALCRAALARACA
jgi:DNA (cytosine-5)-methyltransferase 1